MRNPQMKTSLSFATALALAVAVSAQASSVTTEFSSTETGFATIPDISNADLAAGLTTQRDFGGGNFNAAVTTDGLYGAGFNNNPSNGPADVRYRIDLGSAQLVGSVNSYSFGNGNLHRAEQKFSLYGSTEAAPSYDETSSDWNLLGSVNSDGGNGGGVNYGASSIDTINGTYRWVMWVASPVSPAGGGEGTIFKEFDVNGAASTLMIGEAQFNAGNVTPSPITAVSGDLLETSVASVTGENGGANVRNGTTGTAHENTGTNPASVWGQTTTTYNLDLTGAGGGYAITDINVFSGWSDGRAGQSYEIWYSQIGSSDFILLSAVQELVSDGSLLTRTYNTDGSVVLMNVDAIRFVQVNSGLAGTGTVFREFDVIGKAIPTPAALPAGIALLGLAAARRRRR